MSLYRLPLHLPGPGSSKIMDSDMRIVAQCRDPETALCLIALVNRALTWWKVGPSGASNEDKLRAMGDLIRAIDHLHKGDL